jgi:hypothetical protein
MSEAAKYRRLAADSFAVAQHLTDPNLKAAMLGMARSWLTLADHSEEGAAFSDAPALGPPPRGRMASDR